MPFRKSAACITGTNAARPETRARFPTKTGTCTACVPLGINHKAATISHNLIAKTRHVGRCLGTRPGRVPAAIFIQPAYPEADEICERHSHLKLILKPWVAHFNHGRPHMSLGPGIPEPLHHPPPEDGSRHSFAAGHVIRSKPVLGGLHHEYWLEEVAA